MKRLEGRRAVAMGAGENMKARGPHGRLVQPEEIDAMAAYLSPRTSRRSERAWS